MQARVPIVPVTIIGSRQVLPKNSIIFRPGPIDMYVDAPIPTDGLKDEDLEELMRTVRAHMARHFRDQAGADFSV
jgi:1-acyl-sn-glycerol-3-phosphate acyltransferase